MDAFDFFVQMGLMGQPLFLFIKIRQIKQFPQKTSVTF